MLDRMRKDVNKIQKALKPEEAPRIVVCWHTEEEQAAGLCDCTPEGELVKVVTWDEYPENAL